MLRPVCDLCFVGGEEKTLGMLTPRACCLCGTLCGPGSTSPGYHFPCDVPEVFASKSESDIEKPTNLGAHVSLWCALPGWNLLAT